MYRLSLKWKLPYSFQKVEAATEFEKALNYLEAEAAEECGDWH
jgi:hypothetical protein